MTLKELRDRVNALLDVNREDTPVMMHVAEFDTYQPVGAVRLSGVVKTDVGLGDNNWQDVAVRTPDWLPQYQGEATAAVLIDAE